jgi:hypothetical protein
MKEELTEAVLNVALSVNFLSDAEDTEICLTANAKEALLAFTASVRQPVYTLVHQSKLFNGILPGVLDRAEVNAVAIAVATHLLIVGVNADTQGRVMITAADMNVGIAFAQNSLDVLSIVLGQGRVTGLEQLAAGMAEHARKMEIEDGAEDDGGGPPDLSQLRVVKTTGLRVAPASKSSAQKTNVSTFLFSASILDSHEFIAVSLSQRSKLMRQKCCSGTAT